MDITFKSQFTSGISLSCSCAQPYQLALAASVQPLPGTITTCIPAKRWHSMQSIVFGHYVSPRQARFPFSPGRLGIVSAL